jgi:uncharacterized protein YbcC (UPF0753/DUF2309 family)
MSNHHQLEHIVHEIEHFLPSQAPLKDFIHHNTLHAFQYLPFHEGLNVANQLFGYQTYMNLSEYRALYQQGKIADAALERVLPTADFSTWKTRLLSQEYNEEVKAKVGSMRNAWKRKLGFDLDAMVHPILFRLVSSYLDQGISIWKFPLVKSSFLESIRALESLNTISLFAGQRAKNLLLDPTTTLESCLTMLVGSAAAYEAYLVDQQFAHPGYSGMVAQLAARPGSLIEKRPIEFTEYLILECLLEIDALDKHQRNKWKSLSELGIEPYEFDLKSIAQTEVNLVKAYWQEAYEWSYYDQVLAGLSYKTPTPSTAVRTQGIFCIDDRECSIRRHIETAHPSFESFGTPGHFAIEAYFQPEGSEQLTKICPAPLSPTHVIREKSVQQAKTKEFHFDPRAYGLVLGWILTHTYGFWSALKLAFSIFKPSMNKMAVSSNSHMHHDAILSIEQQDNEVTAAGMKVGFSIEEMQQAVENLLKSIGLTQQFGRLVYVIAHGSSSANNTHYAGYDCGACSGRPGSVNARAFAFMANHPLVRQALKTRGLDIPDHTHFVPVLHDTSRDEFRYYDLNLLPSNALTQFKEDQLIFEEALHENALERSRRFVTSSSSRSSKVVHDQVKLRSVSLFEPRPELNHATNSLCIVGRRSFSRNLFFDRRSFLNSFDYKVDPAGNYLLGILNAVAPVCGGINLEYYFSRVDNQQLGAGTKLPHNVMGLIGVANGIDGDLRTGLPSQMIEVHDPYRLLVIVEHHPDVVLKTIQKNPATWEWFANEWVRIVAFDPDLKQMYILKNGVFEAYETLQKEVQKVQSMTAQFRKDHENLPIVELQTLAS